MGWGRGVARELFAMPGERVGFDEAASFGVIAVGGTHAEAFPMHGDGEATEEGLREPAGRACDKTHSTAVGLGRSIGQVAGGSTAVAMRRTAQAG